MEGALARAGASPGALKPSYQELSSSVADENDDRTLQVSELCQRRVSKMTGLSNNAMQLTRGARVASGLRRTHHSLVPLAADRECCPG